MKLNKSNHIRTGMRGNGTLLLMVLAVLTAGIMPAALAETPEGTDRIPELVLVGPPGPMAIPLAYLAENDKLADIADKTRLVVWENSDQLRSIAIGGSDAHFLTMPSHSASTFYNKGADLKLLDISVWGIIYVISTDPAISSIEDLKGEEIVISMQGEMPDVLFSYICQKNGIDTAKDLTIYYANTPQQAASLILSGEKKHAVLTEPLVTQVIMRGKNAGLDISRVIDMQVEWSHASGLEDRVPIAGTVALPAIKDNPAAISRFMEEYAGAVAWLKENPDQAGVLGSQVEQLGFEAKPIEESTRNIRWDFIPITDCRDEVETFFSALYELNPKIIGDKLPDDGFYFR